MTIEVEDFDVAEQIMVTFYDKKFELKMSPKTVEGVEYFLRVARYVKQWEVTHEINCVIKEIEYYTNKSVYRTVSRKMSEILYEKLYKYIDLILKIRNDVLFVDSIRQLFGFEIARPEHCIPNYYSYESIEQNCLNFIRTYSGIYPIQLYYLEWFKKYLSSSIIQRLIIDNRLVKKEKMYIITSPFVNFIDYWQKDRRKWDCDKYIIIKSLEPFSAEYLVNIGVVKKLHREYNAIYIKKTLCDYRKTDNVCINGLICPIVEIWSCRNFPTDRGCEKWPSYIKLPNYMNLPDKKTPIYKCTKL